MATALSGHARSQAHAHAEPWAWHPLLVAAFCASLGLGCQKADEIRSYTVPKEPAAAVATDRPAEAGEPTDRMLTAIVPVGNQAWFFKVVAPLSSLVNHEKQITDFFSTIRVADGRARWELPEGWKEDGPAAMRAATLWIPEGGEPLEMSVTTLPWSGTQQDLLANVNRWRGQLQLPQIGAEQLAQDTRELKAAYATITIVDLRGRYQASGMMGPVGAASRAAPGDATELPEGHPPIDGLGGAENTAPSIADPAAGAPKFEAPSSWQELPVTPGGMRKAAFNVADGEQQALVTVIDFAASAPKIADPLENVNRWRGEIGLPKIENEALNESVQSIEIDGQPARYVKLIPDASKPEQSQADRATLAAMVIRGDRIWFIKMTGSRDLVAAQDNEFESFLKSIRFAADGGADDGN